MDGLGHHLESRRQQRQGRLAGVREQNLPSRAPEQRCSRELLKLPNLLRNGARGNVQLLRRPGEGQMARRGLEGAQGVKSGEAVFLSHIA